MYFKSLTLWSYFAFLPNTPFFILGLFNFTNNSISLGVHRVRMNISLQNHILWFKKNSSCFKWDRFIWTYQMKFALFGITNVGKCSAQKLSDKLICIFCEWLVENQNYYKLAKKCKHYNKKNGDITINMI